MADHPRTKLQYVITAAITLPALYLSFLIYQSGQFTIALILLCLTLLFNYVYLSSKAYTYRYLFPGLIGFGLFVIFPLIYTFVIGFTKYDANHLLSHQRVKSDFLNQNYIPEDAVSYRYVLYRQDGNPDSYRLWLESEDLPEGSTKTRFISEPFPLYPPGEIKLGSNDSSGPIPLDAAPEPPTGTPLQLADITRPKLYLPLKTHTFTTPDGPGIQLESLRSFTTLLPLWKEVDEGQNEQLKNLQSGEIITANHEAGRYENENGEQIGFGFRTWTGMDNYKRIVKDERVKGPFIKIFIWTIIFSAASVLLTFALGMVLAVLLEWESLKGRKIYRTLLILPYAVPAFLSILVFKGMFNQEAGAINEVLSSLFNIKPEWITDPKLAKAMVLIVNVWLGYPYMMLISTGVLQSIPKQIYEASSIDGSNTIHDFFKLTLPLIITPLAPLLIASFAFNFNNFNLIFLLTQGGPKMVNSTGVAGETDILVTYTFNLAFMDSGNNYGLACAIATILFAIVGTLAWINLKMTNKNAALR